MPPLGRCYTNRHERKSNLDMKKADSDLYPERLCGRISKSGDRIRVGKERSGIERVEVDIRREGFAPHRHDTYAIGLTISGVQAFRYRGARRYCLPQQCHILHPDEVHDGSPTSLAGFSYRILYVAPSLVQKALGGKPLPFVAEPVVNLRVEQFGLLARLWNVGDDLDDVEDDEIALSITGFLERLSRCREPNGRRLLPWAALQRACDRLAAEPSIRCSMEELEAVSGLDRWTLARDFRTAYGTSPRGFRTMRQLDQVRRLLVQGVSFVDAALEAGFSDQSHMTRMFKRAYGLTPLQWVIAVASSGTAFKP